MGKCYVVEQAPDMAWAGRTGELWHVSYRMTTGSAPIRIATCETLDYAELVAEALNQRHNR